MKSKLPPLEDKDFDGKKYRVKLKNKRCTHKQAELVSGVIYCPCGAMWQGPGIDILWKEFQKRNGKD